MKINIKLKKAVVTPLMELHLDDIQGYLEHFLNNPNKDNFNDIKSHLEGYAWSYAEEVLAKRINTEPSRSDIRQYDLRDDLRNISPGLTGFYLRLQERTDRDSGESWCTISVRDKLKPSGKNRRFNFSKGEFWHTNLEEAIEKLSLAEDEGWFFEDNYDHRQLNLNDDDHYIVSQGITKNEKERYLKETITKDEADEGPFSNPDQVEFIIDNCAGPIDDPKLWRKVCLYNKEQDYLTFRSLTTDNTWKSKVFLNQEGSEWIIDNSMMDASAQTMQRFLMHLEQEQL